jgi:hypothetical protein
MQKVRGTVLFAVFPALIAEPCRIWRRGAVMTETLEAGATRKKPEPMAEQKATEVLVRRAREQGLSLTDWTGRLNS